MYDTKINLATILGIIVFLAVMAFLFYPVTSGPHRSVVGGCVSNIKQQDISQIMYASDFDDRFPNCEAWMDLCKPYIKNEDILHCPVIDRAQPDLYGYAMHIKLSSRLASDYSDLSQQVLILESAIMDRNASSGLVGFPNPSRHKRNTIAFADGHAKADESLAKYR